MKRTAFRALGLALLAAGLGGCIYRVPQEAALAPNPVPPPGYRVECTTTELALPSVAVAKCYPIVPAAEPVLRAKG